MKLATVADEIFRELEEPSDIGIPSIVFWLSSNVGKLISALDSDFSISNAEDIFPDLSEDEKSVFKLLYFVYYYRRQIRNNLGAASYSDTITEITEGNRTVRKISKNEIAKNWRLLAKDTQEDLDDAIIGYKIGKSMPLQVDASTYGVKGIQKSNGVELSQTLWLF